jgi:hypothetical protein
MFSIIILANPGTASALSIPSQVVSNGIVCISNSISRIFSDIDPAASGEINDPSLESDDTSGVAQFHLSE